MDAVDLVTIENRALAAGNPRIIPPVRIEILGKIAAEDVPELTEEVRRCWERIAEMEEADRVWDKTSLVEMATERMEFKQRIAELETQIEQMESAAMDRAIERERDAGMLIQRIADLEEVVAQQCARCTSPEKGAGE